MIVSFKLEPLSDKMDKTDQYQIYQELCQKIWEHSKHYYIDHAPIISDEEFDYLMKKLIDMEKIHPEWIYPGSPTQRVGEALTAGFKTVEHRTPMLSLANTYTKDELSDFIKRMRKLVGNKEIAFSCELKIDGIAISVRYEKGLFVQGLTRGDGRRGDEISANLRTIANFPLQLFGKNLPEFMEIRGEVFIPKKVFKELNDLRAQRGELLWANPRNAAAGSLKLLDPREVAKRGLAVIFYGVAEDSALQLKSQYGVHAYLKSLGLPTLQQVTKCHSLEEIWEYAEKIRQLRSEMPFDIDGIVVKIDDMHEHKRLGATGKDLRWAVAYKFAAEQAVTRLLNITVQIGRTGVLTPVAELEPIVLAGSTIARATLHNEDEVARLDVRLGDLVTIEKGGDVIPKVVEVDLSARVNSEKWSMPKKCPSCGAEVVRVPGEVAVRCPNQENCPEQQLRKMTYFAGKEGMDIEGMGEKVVEQLVRRKFVVKPSDIYQLSEKELSQLEGFKEKSIQNLLRSIQQSQKVTLSRFIMALGIKHVGISTAELLAAKVGSIDALASMSKEELSQIEGIGPKVGLAIEEYFKETRNREEIARLLENGVIPQNTVVKSFVDHAFNGQIFVLTGTLQNYTRSAAATLIKERGGKVTDSVSKKTNYLLAGAESGSKLEKAQSLGITILNEEEFSQML